MKVVKELWSTSMSRVYFKIIKTGNVKKGDKFELIKSCLENKTIAEVYETKK